MIETYSKPNLTFKFRPQKIEEMRHRLLEAQKNDNTDNSVKLKKTHDFSSKLTF